MRDLNDLEELKLVTRYHGGAKPAEIAVKDDEPAYFVTT